MCGDGVGMGNNAAGTGGDGDRWEKNHAGTGGDGVSVDFAGRGGDTFPSPCSSLLAALDLLAAFDTIDHETLIRRLRSSFGIEDKSLSWISSYLTDRWQHVKFDGISSTPLRCECGVPQGSVLGPLLFTAYVAPVANVIASFGVSFHQFADDTQLYISVQPRSSITPLDKLD